MTDEFLTIKCEQKSCKYYVTQTNQETEFSSVRISSLGANMTIV